MGKKTSFIDKESSNLRGVHFKGQHYLHSGVLFARDFEYYYFKCKRYITDPLDIYRDPAYNKIVGLLNELDSLEYRKNELRDAPNKLCNQSCNARQKFLIKLYEENAKILNHVQTNLMLQLNEELREFYEKYNKRFEKIKKKYHLKDEDLKWVSKLNQCS